MAGIIKTVFPVIAVLIFSASMLPQSGSIKGHLADADTKLPLFSANIIILNSTIGAASDSAGNYIINNVLPGAYTIRISYIGYMVKTITDVIVRPDRITFLNEELSPSGIDIDAVEVTGGYFNNDGTAGTSTNFSYEEIRRAPGSAGDISRILMSLPSVAKVNDQSSSLIVRGGNPSENLFIIDNIAVPNINHFPMQGSTGGPISMLNIDFVDGLNFIPGGFSSVYGNRLSSVMEISFREGNKDEFDGQLDLNISGFGAQVEGPLPGNGSFIFSARRSYLDFLIKSLDLGTSIAPRYGDLQWKIVYDINPYHKLSFIGLMGDDHSNSDEKTAEENKMEAYGVQDMSQATAGINWRALWGSTAFSNTSLSLSSSVFRENYFKAGNGDILLDNHSDEFKVTFRNVNHIKAGMISSFQVGGDAEFLFNSYNNLYGQAVNLQGKIVTESFINNNLNGINSGIFINYTFIPAEKYTIVLGARGDYYSFGNKFYVDPRISISYRLSGVSLIKASAGIYHQQLPDILISQNAQYKKLSNPGAVHYQLALEHLITENTKLTFEAYLKEYSNLPVDPEQPGLLIIDENIYSNSFYGFHNKLLSSGRAYSRGIELTIQKKLAKDFYGLAGVSYSRTKYKALDNIWRSRVFDNRLIVGIEGGYKPNNEWEFSARWIYAGGIPYTSWDVAASKAANTGIMDLTRINETRYPDYHSLNVRLDKRFNFSSSNLVVYISIWNAYNRKNVTNYFWNSFKNEQDVTYQWSLLPIFGIEYEF